MASCPYYESGEKLKAKYHIAGGGALDVPQFALNKVDLKTVTTAADIGCGWGRFAVPLLDRAPRLERLVCSDVWSGMVGTCSQTLAEAGHRADCLVADVRNIGLRSHAFDFVMANHMLYVIKDVASAIAELARLLRPDGQLLATTYSGETPIPTQDLHFEVVAEVWQPYPPPEPFSFTLENGHDYLRALFDDVECHVLEEVKRTDDAESFVAHYLNTGGYDWVRRDESIPAEARARVPDVYRRKVCERIQRDGAIETVTLWTTFVARGPRRA